MVEFALILPVLVLLTFGIIEFAVAFNADSTVASATRAGGRTAAILSTDPQMSFKAGQAAATALDINPTSIVGNAVVCVAQYLANNPDPCTEPTSTKMTLVHTGAVGVPRVAGRGPERREPRIVPRRRQLAGQLAQLRVSDGGQPRRQLRPRDRARRDQAQASRTRDVQRLLRQ